MSAVTVFHCELAWLGGDEAVAIVAVHVEGSRITGVVPGVESPTDAVRLSGLTLPGLANSHSHAFHRALRSRTHGGRGTFWTWRDEMYALAKVLDPDSYFRLARATFAEMVCAGITSVGEFHYIHHDQSGARYNDPNEMGQALIGAASEAGLRITLLDTCYLSGGFGADLNDVQRRFSDRTAEAWAERVEALTRSDTGVKVIVGAAVHSVRAVDADSIGTVASLHVFASLTQPFALGTELFGPLLLQDDIVEERPVYGNFSITVPDKPGLGVAIDEDKLAHFRRDKTRTTRPPLSLKLGNA